MGGDFGSRLVVPAVVTTLRKYSRLRCQLHGNQDELEPLLAKAADVRSRLAIIHAPQQVAMDEKPGAALRHKRQSSMWNALEAVASGQASACVSAGNTGALMAMGMSLVNTIPGIERPAICTALPTARGKAYLLDMGANIGCDARQLFQFAHMASAMVAEVDLLPSPRIGLLNVGSEAGKGDRVVQQADDLLRADASLNYQGFVEGDGIFSGDFDIIVCDGFVGNVALKSTEGAARMIVGKLRHEIDGSIVAKLAALVARPALLRLQKMLDPANYNGANLLGLNGIVIKSHGSASEPGFCNALEVAIKEVEKNIPARISEKLALLGSCGPADCE